MPILTAALYTASFAWGVYATGLWNAVTILGPVLIGLFCWISWKAVRRSVAASRALGLPELLLPFYRAYLDERILDARRERIIGPVIVGVTWLGILVIGVRAGWVYWFGAALVSVAVLGSAWRAYWKLPELIREREGLQ